MFYILNFDRTFSFRVFDDIGANKNVTDVNSVNSTSGTVIKYFQQNRNHRYL